MDKLLSVFARNGLPAIKTWALIIVLMIAGVATFFFVSSYVHGVNQHALDHCQNNLSEIALHGHSHCTASPAHIINIWE